jgi:hypothetical protein
LGTLPRFRLGLECSPDCQSQQPGKSLGVERDQETKEEGTVNRTNIRFAVLAAAGLAVIGGVAGNWVSPAALAAPAQAKPRALPVFEVEKDWPKIPAKWKIGDGSHFAVDAQDNVLLLHRPRTLKAGDAAMAAPPVIVFDNAGNFLKAWGGAGSGYEWPEREHGIHVDNKGMVWITGNNCPPITSRG